MQLLDSIKTLWGNRAAEADVDPLVVHIEAVMRELAAMPQFAPFNRWPPSLLNMLTGCLVKPMGGRGDCLRLSWPGSPEVIGREIFLCDTEAIDKFVALMRAQASICSVQREQAS